MWIDGKFMTEPEIMAYIKQVKEDAFREGYLKAVDTMAQETAKEMSDLEKQRDAYKKELMRTNFSVLRSSFLVKVRCIPISSNIA